MLGDRDSIALNHIIAAKGTSPLVTFLPLILIVVAFYFFLIRPQRNRQRAAAQLQNQLVPGQRVMTTAGMFATVVEVDDDGIILEISPGVEARFVRQAIGQVLPDEIDDEEEEYEDDEEFEEDEAPQDVEEAAGEAGDKTAKKAGETADHTGGDAKVSKEPEETRSEEKKPSA